MKAPPPTQMELTGEDGNGTGNYTDSSGWARWGRSCPPGCSTPATGCACSTPMTRPSPRWKRPARKGRARRPKWRASRRRSFSVFPNPEIVQNVALGRGGVIEGTRVKRVADFSTIGPRTAGIVAKALAERKITYVDAPVSGGLKGAREGTLAVMVSCPKSVYAELEPVLKTFGKPFHLGEVAGQAQTMKLANNLLAAAAIAVSSEAMVMGVKAGLDPKLMLDILNAGTGRNSATADKFPRSDSAGHFRFRLCHRAVVQGRAALHRRGRVARRADGGGCRGAPDAGGDQRGLRRRLGFHLDLQGGRVVGRCRSTQQVTGRTAMATVQPVERQPGSPDRRAARSAHRALGRLDVDERPAGRSDRQGKALSVRPHRLRLRVARSAVEPAGGRTG